MENTIKNKKYAYKQESQEDMVFEFSDFAVYAEKEILVSCGQTKVLITIANGGKSDKNYLPLKVDYEEKYYARGEILGGKYNKREGRPSTEAILTARVIDRAIRPYFPKSMTNDLHVVVSVLSLGKYDPDILALNGVSLALMTSKNLSWNGPVFANRVIVTEEQESLVVNPTYKERENNFSTSLIAFKEEGSEKQKELKVCMIENDSSQISEEKFLEVVEKSKKEAQKMQNFFEEVLRYDGLTKEEKKEDKRFDIESDKEKKNKIISDILTSDWENFYEKKVLADLSIVKNRPEVSQIKKDFLEMQREKFAGNDDELIIEEIYLSEKDLSQGIVSAFVDKKMKEILRSEILKNKRRLDGRELDQVRDLKIQLGGFSDIHHGTGIFYRGHTRIFSVLTMGGLEDAQVIEGMEIQTNKRYIHHYNFPPFSVGETGRLGSPKRREIGHGALAEKAIKRVLPSRDEFPYAMRIVSEAFSSNGSTSMGATTGSALALLDAGVPIPAVTGIAIGLIYEKDFTENENGEKEDRYEFITDILGIEDHFGDMDFKVTGTKKGITAMQLDIKNVALDMQMIKEILKRAKVAREYILDQIEEAAGEPKELTDKVDRVEKMRIPREKIGLVIGKGGATIKKITKESGAKVNIKRDGEVFLTGANENIKKAIEKINEIIK